MRRMLVSSIVAGVLAVTAVSAAGCGHSGAGAPHTVAGLPRTAGSPTGPAAGPAGDWPAGVKEAEVYVQVLHRYLTAPNENSFPAGTFKTIYVLDRAYRDAANPSGKKEKGTPIAANTQQQVISALAGVGQVTFIADGKTVIDTKGGCAQVRNGGILVTLGTVDGDDNEVKVAINGFVACLGATWLTYVVKNQPGTGWRVTGKTGPMAIA